MAPLAARTSALTTAASKSFSSLAFTAPRAPMSASACRAAAAAAADARAVSRLSLSVST